MLSPPSELVKTGDYKVLDVLCKSVKVPDISNEPIELKYKGHTVKIPGRTNQEQVMEITFYLDENQNIRQLFHEWITALDNRFYAYTSAAATSMAKSKNYFGTILLKARDFDESKREPMNYLIDGVYPISVSGPEFNAGGTNEVIEITVTFAFYRFLSKDINENYDEFDIALDKFGLSPREIGNLESFGQVGNLLSSGLRTINSVKNAFNSIGGLF
jgi:hypothetical protein